DFRQCQLAALIVQFLEPVEAIPAIPHNLTGMAHAAELLRELQQPDLCANDLLFCRHEGVLQTPRWGASPPRPAPRPTSASDSPWDTRTPLSDQILANAHNHRAGAGRGRPRTRPKYPVAATHLLDPTH